MSTVIGMSAFCFVGALNVLLYIPQTQNLPSWSCGFTLQLYSWREGFGSSSLVTLPLGFNYDFIATSGYGSSTGVYFCGCPGGLGFAPVRTRCEGGAAAWVTGVLTAPGSGGLVAKAEGNVLRKGMATSIGQYARVFLPGEPPFLTEKPGRPQSTGLQWVGYYWSDPVHTGERHFLPVAALPQWDLNVKVVQLLGLQRPRQHHVCRDMDCLPCRSYGPIRVFFPASCSWRSEGLFGQSFSITPPIQALRRLPCLGSYSVDQCIRHLKGHPGWGPTL